MAHPGEPIGRASAPRQKDLDHREAELNARGAQLESDLRCARLWLSERIAELQERAAAPDAGPPAGTPSVQPAAAALEAKQKQLEDAQSHFEAERRRAMAEVEEQATGGRPPGRARGSQPAGPGATPRRTGSPAPRNLEIRLATEELWAQLSGAAPPAALVQSLAQIRASWPSITGWPTSNCTSRKRSWSESAATSRRARETGASQGPLRAICRRRAERGPTTGLPPHRPRTPTRSPRGRTSYPVAAVASRALRASARTAALRSELAARGQDAASREASFVDPVRVCRLCVFRLRAAARCPRSAIPGAVPYSHRSVCPSGCRQ